jgi:hypothetical protein
MAVQTKQISKHIHNPNNTKNTVQTKPVNTSTHVNETNTHYKTHTYMHSYTHTSHKLQLQYRLQPSQFKIYPN